LGTNDLAIGKEGTFAYEFVVPDEPQGDSRRIKGVLHKRLGPGERRLLGEAPVLETIEYQREAWQLYARVVLTASDKRTASVASACFSVDRELMRMLRRGDVLNVSRTRCGGIGLSVLRNDHLVAAAGAIAHVPLGVGVSVHTPSDLVHQAEAVFQTRDPQYRSHEHPIEVSIGGETRIVHRGARIDPYELFIRHGFLPGMPGTDVCASIERRGVCPDTAAVTSAQLLEAEGLQMKEWDR
jgi:hypothetical protein